MECEYVTMTSTGVVHRMLCSQTHLCMKLLVASTCGARVYQSPLPMHRVLHTECVHSLEVVCVNIGETENQKCTTIAHRSWAIRCVERQLVSASHIFYHDYKFYRWSIGWFSILGCRKSIQIFECNKLRSLKSIIFFSRIFRIVYSFTSSIICGRVPGLTPAQRQLCTEVPDAFVALGAGHMLGAQECQHQFKGEIHASCSRQ